MHQHSDKEIEEFYEEINKALKYVKSDEILIVMGDWNAKVGSKKTPGITGGNGFETWMTRDVDL